jgi:uronate dehydrogenase
MYLFEGVDVVLHLAGDVRNSAPWEAVALNNIQATWNVIEAAAKYHVPRVVFASSNWAVKALEKKLAPECYLREGPKIDSNAHPSPIRPYGLSKAFGELAGQMFVDQSKLASFIAVRIGYYNTEIPQDTEPRTRWIGKRDIRSLLRRCVEAEFKGFHVVYGVSAQPNSPYDLSYAKRLLRWEPSQRL